MLAQIGINKFSFRYSNFTVSANGQSIVPGASNVEGSPTQVASAANISQDIYYIILQVSGGNTSAAQKDHLLDILVDPAGGTTYVPAHFPQNIVCGSSHNAGNGGRWYAFPVMIKAGSSVAVQIQGSNATAGTVAVGVWFYGQPSHPELIRVGQYSETIGTITDSGGVVFTPGNSGADGSWVSLGTTTRALWHWQLCVQISNAGTSARTYLFDLAYGDATNKTMIIEDFEAYVSSGETLVTSLAKNPLCDVPAGGEIWVRGTCSGNTDTGWNAVAVGIGG